MIKKMGIAALAVVAGMFILNSTHLGSYARTAFHKAKVTFKKQVPLEFQLEALKNESARLVPDMKEQVNTLAAKQVAVERLEKQIDLVRASLDKQKDDVRVMASDLKADTKFIKYNGVNWTRGEIHDKLTRDLGSCKRCAEELAAKEQLLKAEKQTLEKAKEQLASMKSQKEQIEVEIAQLEAELKTVRLAQTRSNFALDDSRLADIKARLADIRDQLRVKQVECDMWGAFENGQIKVEKKQSDSQLSAEAEAFLNGQSEPTVAEARK
jgi:chromosome segregation ATPase